MNNLQRGIYQPLADKVPIYDLADEDPEEERSRVPLLVVIALVVLAAFAGVVWLAYNQGVERGRQGASLVITAPEGPVRVAPPDAAPATPFTGLNVYNDPVPPELEAKALGPGQAGPDTRRTARDPPQSGSTGPSTRPASVRCCRRTARSGGAARRARACRGSGSSRAAGADRAGRPAAATGSTAAAACRRPNRWRQGAFGSRRAAAWRVRKPGTGKWRLGDVPLPLRELSASWRRTSKGPTSAPRASSTGCGPDRSQIAPPPRMPARS